MAVATAVHAAVFFIRIYSGSSFARIKQYIFTVSPSNDDEKTSPRVRQRKYTRQVEKRVCENIVELK